MNNRILPTSLIVAAFATTTNANDGAPDFNGDGIDDLLVGCPAEDINGDVDAGTLEQLFGSPAGLVNSQPYYQALPGVPGGSSPGSRYGEVFAWGDFDGDGIDDLAIGNPSADTPGTNDHGEVHVFHSSDPSLDGVVNIVGLSADYRFGSALAAGDVEGDGFDDLMVGSPRPDDSGILMIIKGCSAGIPAVCGVTTVAQDQFPGDGTEPGDRFAEALDVGDFDGDGTVDVAIGAPGEDATATDQGLLHVFYTGQVGSNYVTFAQGTGGVFGLPEVGDQFGSVLEAGDLNADGRDDLVIGVPDEDFGAIPDSGLVYIMYGSASGVTATGSLNLYQTDFGGTTAAGDRFGHALALGDIFGDGSPELVIGMPGFQVEAGAIYLALGVAGLLLPVRAPLLAPLHAAGQEWGAALASGDYNGDGLDDLAVGAPGALFGADHGGVQILSLSFSQTIIQGLAGVTPGTSFEPGDRVGESL